MLEATTRRIAAKKLTLLLIETTLCQIWGRRRFVGEEEEFGVLKERWEHMCTGHAHPFIFVTFSSAVMLPKNNHPVP